MRDKALKVLAIAAFTAAALIVVLAMGGPSAIFDGSGANPQGAGASAPVIGPADGLDAKSAHKLTARQRAALAAPAGTYGEKTGATHYSEIVSGGRWNPCAPIRFVVNPAGAPAGAVADFRVALRKVSTATGMRLVLVGRTDASDPNWIDVPGRPVLVTWGAGTDGVLNKGADATAQPAAWPNGHGQQVIDGGMITFNVDADKIYPGGVFGTYGSRVSLYMHEIGHIVGLGHVEDPDQLMFESVGATKDFGAGDLAGLAALTNGPCRTR